MDPKIIGIGVIVIVAIAAILLMNQGPPAPGKYDAFARCLTDAGVTMYGTDSCTYCKAQKSDFGNSFQYVNFVNCDSNRAACDAAGVRAYPTWDYNGAQLTGKQNLQYLSSITSCPLN